MNIPQQNHILVGLGGTGGKVLKAFKKRLFQEFTLEERSKLPIGFLYVDTTDEMMHPGDKSWYVRGESAQFDANEFLYIKGIQLDEIFAHPSSFPGLKGVVGDPKVMRKIIGLLGGGAGQMRRAGRILFGANVFQYRAAMENVYNRVNDISKASGTRIYIFGGLAGGTGSGSIVDVIAQTRMIPAFKDGYQTTCYGKSTGTNIVAYAMIPEIYPPYGYDVGRYHANGYAALKELNALFCKAWKPYDLTGKSPTGRLEFDGIRRIADGLMIYSNENENGVTFDSHNELPQAVADFVHRIIFWEYNDGSFIRTFYQYEDVPELAEMFENAKNGTIIPYRTKTVGSFGIKRVIYPEEEIKDYMSHSAARQVLLRLRYNNWIEDFGFSKGPVCVDWTDYVKGQDKELGDPLERWRFSDKHLMLDIPILPSDEWKWGTFQSYWGNVVPKWLEEAQSTSQPIAKLNELCAKGLQTGFRSVGVSDFFSGKKEVKDKLADEIVQRMEADLFDKLWNGTSALYNLLELIDTIFSETENKIRCFEDKLVELRQLLDGLERERQAKANEYNDAGFIPRWLKGRRMLAGYGEIMQEICLKRTEVEACGFAVGLLKVILIKESNLRCRLEDLVYMVSDAIDGCEKKLSVLCRDDEDAGNLERVVVRCYDPSKVRIYTKEMIVLDKENQDTVYAAVRQDIMNRIGTEKTFARTNAVIGYDTSFDTIIETTVRERTKMIAESINRGVLKELSEKYSSSEDLQRFAMEIISGGGVLARFNPTEVDRNVNNNPVTVVGCTVMRRRVFVSIPKVERDESVRTFAKDLKTALENATDASVMVEVNMSGEMKNELTVLSVASYFPLRCLQNLSYYKEKYDHLTTVSPTLSESEVRRNKIILFGEGEGGEGLPDLFVSQEG